MKWTGMGGRWAYVVGSAVLAAWVGRALADELLFGRLMDGGRLTVDMKITTDDKGVETGEVQLDIQPLPKKEGKSKPEEATAR